MKPRFISIFTLISFLFWNIYPLPVKALTTVPQINQSPVPVDLHAKSLRLEGNCGPKVLQKILQTFGQKISLDHLVRITKTQKGQTNLKNLEQGGRSQGLWTLAIHTDSETLEELIKRGYFVIAHVGGNKHFVWINEMNDRWIQGYNPAVRNENWKLPRKVFDSIWEGEALLVWKPFQKVAIETQPSSHSEADVTSAEESNLIRSFGQSPQDDDMKESCDYKKASLHNYQMILLGFALPLGLESKIKMLSQARMEKIWGGAVCQNTTSNGGQEKGGCKTGEPVDISNGDLVMAARDFSIEALGPDLVLERSYHVQLFSDIEGWQSEEGTGSWSIENGTYAGAGDRSGTTETWKDFNAKLSVQTIEPGSEDYHTAWVNFRYMDENNRYYFLMKTNGVLELTKFKNGVQSYLMSKSSSYNPLTAHNLQIQMQGGLIQIWIDGKLEIQYTDSNPITEAGKIVLESYYCHAHYDNIEIKNLSNGSLKKWDFSKDDNNDMFGRGWRSNIEINLIFKTNGNIVVRRGNDRRDEFAWNSAKSGWTSPMGIFETLAKTSNGYDLKIKDGTIHHFGINGRLEAIEDRYKNTLSLIYTTISGIERVSQIKEAKGRTLNFNYDSNARCTSIVDPIGRTVNYTYNSEGLLETAKDPRGNSRTYQYDSHHRMTQYIDRNGNVFQYQYIYNNRTISQTDPEGNTTYFDYLWDVTQVTDASGNIWTYLFDWKGTLVSQTNPEGITKNYEWGVEYILLKQTNPKGNTTEKVYDINGNVTSSIDPYGESLNYTYGPLYNQVISAINKGGYKTTFAYDSNGNLINIKDPLNYMSTMTYSSQGQMLTLTDKKGKTTTYTYDDYGHIKTMKDSLGYVTTYTYDEGGRLTQVTNALINTTKYQYDSNNNLIHLTDPLNHAWTFTYDANDNKTLMKDPLGNTTTWIYNAYDKVKTMIDPIGRVTSYEYDKARFMLTGAVELAEVQDPSGHKTFYKHDEIGRIKEVEDALGNITSYEYDPNNNVTHITDANGNVTEYQYDNLDRVTAVIYADNSIELSSYDKDGNLTHKTLRDESTITNIFNGRNEMIKRQTNDGTTDAYTYDGNGNLTHLVRNGSSTWSYAYDADNRVTKIMDGFGRIVKYTYDKLHRRTKLTYPDNMVIQYIYDKDNRLTQIQEGTTPPLTLATYGYDDANRRTSRTLGNDVVSTYSYDAANQLLSLITKSDSTILSGYNYIYDSLGNRVKQTDRSGKQTYDYDPLSQLIQAKYSNGMIQDYQYDSVYNRIHLTQSGIMTSYTPNNLNQITESVSGSTASTYNWDARGNILQKASGLITSTYTHNIMNQLSKVTQTNQSDTSFTYDPLGRRITKTIGSTPYKYAWDGDQLIEVRNSSGNVLRKFIFGVGIDEPIVLKSGSTRYYYTHDGLGSISEFSNSKGLEIEYYRYDVYGKPTLYHPSGTLISKSNYNNPYYFTGREYDFETGLYYYRARYYDPSIGRFLETDPLGYVDSLNLYSYVNNNPWNRTDPSGKTFGLDDLLYGIIIIGGIILDAVLNDGGGFGNVSPGEVSSESDGVDTDVQISTDGGIEEGDDDSCQQKCHDMFMAMWAICEFLYPNDVIAQAKCVEEAYDEYIRCVRECE